MNELLKKSAVEQAKMIADKEVSAVELLNATFDRIDEVESKVRAYNSLCKDKAM